MRANLFYTYHIIVSLLEQALIICRHANCFWKDLQKVWRHLLEMSFEYNEIKINLANRKINKTLIYEISGQNTRLGLLYTKKTAKNLFELINIENWFPYWSLVKLVVRQRVTAELTCIKSIFEEILSPTLSIY